MLGFGMDIQSSTAQASPLYNQNAGIFFGDAGDIKTGENGASAVAEKTPSRQTLGGTNAYPDSTLGGNFLSASGGTPIWVYVVGGLALLGAAIFALKKL
jgi:hypothetical protein